MTPVAALRTLLRRASSRVRKSAVFSVLLAVAARALGVAAALAFADSFERGAVLVAVAAVVFAGERAALGRLRILVEADLHRMSARALLASDVLTIRGSDLPVAIYDGAVHSQALVFGALTLVVDACVVAVAFPMLCAVLPIKGIFALAAAGAVTAVVLRRMRGATRKFDLDVQEAFARATDVFGTVVCGRLQIVANASEETALNKLDERLERWQQSAIRSAWVNGVLTRSSIALGALIATAIVFARGDSVHLANTPRLAALAAVVVSSVVGLALSLAGAHRSAIQASPFVELLLSTPRDENGTVKPLGGSAAFRATSLYFGYGAGSVISGLSFETPEHGVVVLVGPNGSGKSTLLRLMLGLRRAQRGKLEVGEVGFERVDMGALRKAIAYMPQRPYLGEPHEPVRHAFDAVGMSVAQDSVEALLGAVGLGAEADRLVGELSAGQQQRLALARVLAATDARWILLDEPDANLDADGLELLHRLLARWSRDGRLIVVAAHDPAFLRDAAAVVRLSSEGADRVA